MSYGSNGYSLIRYHSDFGVYTHETILDGVKCSLYPFEKGFKKAIEEEIRKKCDKLLPKTLYIEEEIFEDDEDDEEFDNYIIPSDDGYGDDEDEFSQDMKDYIEFHKDNDDQ